VPDKFDFSGTLSFSAFRITALIVHPASDKATQLEVPSRFRKAQKDFGLRAQEAFLQLLLQFA
jgi:hypothetical protein